MFLKVPARSGATAVLLVILSVACGSSATPRVTIGDDVELSLARECVVAGEDQTLKVRAPHPALVAFRAVYADGKVGEPEPRGSGGYGGEALEIVPDSGMLEMKWEISRNASVGRVTVRVRIVQDEEQNEALEFRLVPSGSSC